MLTSILMLAHADQHPGACSYRPASWCLLMLTSILVLAHTYQHPDACSYRPASSALPTESSSNNPFELGAAAGWADLTACLAPSLKHLTLKGDSSGMVRVPMEAMAAIGRLTALQTLTVWTKVGCN